MSLLSTEPLSSMNFRAVVNRVLMSLSAVASSWSELVNELVKVARSLFSATNC